MSNPFALTPWERLAFIKFLLDGPGATVNQLGELLRHIARNRNG